MGIDGETFDGAVRTLLWVAGTAVFSTVVLAILLAMSCAGLRCPVAADVEWRGWSADE